jgi:hypothetical protein
MTIRPDPPMDPPVDPPDRLVLLGDDNDDLFVGVAQQRQQHQALPSDLDCSKKSKSKKDKKKKKKSKRHSKKIKSPPALKEDGTPMGIVEEVARVLKMYSTSDDEKISDQVMATRRPKRRASHRMHRSSSPGSLGLSGPVPGKSVLKKNPKDWAEPSLDQFFKEEDQFDGLVHRRAASISKLDDLETRSQASKGSRFSTFLEDNSTVREILNHLFHKETRQSTTQKIRRRFSMKALEDEELPTYGDNMTVFGDGRSIAGMESVGNQSMPALGNNWDAGSTTSWLHRRRGSILPPPVRPMPVPTVIRQESSTRETHSLVSRGSSALQQSGASTRELENDSRDTHINKIATNESTNKTSPVPSTSTAQTNWSGRRSSISTVFGLSFGNLQDESIETPRTGRRHSLFGIQLGPVDVALPTQIKAKKASQDGKPVVTKHDVSVLMEDFPSVVRQHTESTHVATVIQPVRLPESQVNVISEDEVTPSSMRAPPASSAPKASVHKEASSPLREIQFSAEPPSVTRTNTDDDDDELLDQYIESLVAKELSNHELSKKLSSRSNQDEKSLDRTSDPSRGSRRSREESIQVMDQSVDEDLEVEFFEDEDDNDPILALEESINEHLEALKDGLDKTPRQAKDLGGWFDRNTDRTKILSSVEDRSHYGEIESVEGYSLQESLNSRRSGRYKQTKRDRETDLDSVVEHDHIDDDDYSDVADRRPTLQDDYSDRSYSDHSYSDHSYSDRDYSDREGPSRRDDSHYSRRRSSFGNHSDHGSSQGSRDEGRRPAYFDEYSDYSGRDDDRRDRDEGVGKKHYIDHDSHDHRSEATPDYTKEPSNRTNETDDLTDESPSKVADETTNQSQDAKVNEPDPGVQAMESKQTEDEDALVDFDPENFQPREIVTVDEKPLELNLDTPAVLDGDGQQFKDFPRHDGTAFFRYRLQDWKESVMESKGRMVSFDKVIIREHNLCPGDNPACSDSLPICLDWDHGPIRVWAIDDFEKVKYMFPIPEDAEGMARRLSWTERRELLMDVGGYSDRDIRLAERAFSQMLEDDRKQLEGTKTVGFFSRLFSASTGKNKAPQAQLEDVPDDDADELAVTTQGMRGQPTAEVARV